MTPVPFISSLTVASVLVWEGAEVSAMELQSALESPLARSRNRETRRIED